MNFRSHQTSTRRYKKLTGALLAAMPVISVDNVNRLMSSDLLTQAVERPLLTLRPLGASRQIIVPNAATIAINGNNLHVVDDLVRRTARAEMDANCEAPEERNFRSDPLKLVQADRGVFIAHILTIARAYMEAGFPGNPIPLPSFEAWSNLIRGALIWLGRADPAGSIARYRAADPHRQALAAFLDAMPTVPARRAGFTAAELVA